MKYTYGPIHSRRLGLSLGVNITPGRTCSLNCIYCEEAVPTKNLTLKRSEYAPKNQVIEEIKKKATPKLDYITFSGEGEPTLHSKLGYIIEKIKGLNIPIAVLTNSTLLHLEEVRQDLYNADLVVPSLDAIFEKSFKKVNRPCPGIELETILKSLQEFCQKHQGNILIEILLVQGLNDSLEEVKEIAGFVNELPVNGVQLNTLSRRPTAPGARPVPLNKLEEYKEYFKHPVKIYD